MNFSILFDLFMEGGYIDRLRQMWTDEDMKFSFFIEVRIYVLSLEELYWFCMEKLYEMKNKMKHWFKTFNIFFNKLNVRFWNVKELEINKWESITTTLFKKLIWRVLSDMNWRSHYMLIYWSSHLTLTWELQYIH